MNEKGYKGRSSARNAFRRRFAVAPHGAADDGTAALPHREFAGFNPRIGERLEEFDPREVRRILLGNYAMRYEIQGDTRDTRDTL